MKKLSIGIEKGIENFKKLIDKNVYYVDKSELIEDLINEEVILYTRPRGVGKTLNILMLYYFFSIKQKEIAYLFDALEKGVLTGCLQIAKESIFTGLNNFSVRSILNQYASDCFDFEQDEIDELLKYYDLYNKKDYIKKWYDGYYFYDKEIYNP